MDVAILPESEHRRVVGARLRRLIDMLDINYVQAANLMGISKQRLRNYLEGESYPASYALYRLCRARGIDFNYVYLGDWSGLPSSVGKVLDQELTSAAQPIREEVLAADRTGDGGGWK